MNRGTLTGSWRGYTAKLDWNITQSQEENFSDLTCDLYLVCASGYNIYTGKRNHSVFINGIAYEIVSSLNSRGGEELHLGSITKRIYHNADGTCNISLSALLDVEANIRGTFLKRIDIEKVNIELDKIPRMSTISNTMEGTRELGTPHTIHINKALEGENIVHDVWYVIRGDKGSSNWHYIAQKTKDLNLTFTPSAEHNALQPNSSIIYMDIGIKTYRGETLIGETAYSTGWYMKVPLHLVPTISSVELIELNEKAKSLGIYVQNQSKLKVKVQAQGIEQSTIAKIEVNIGKNKHYAEAKNGAFFVEETNIMQDSGNVDIVVKAIDTRDRVKEYTKRITVQPYELPKITKFVGDRTQTDQRNVKMDIDFTMSSLNGKNRTNWKIEKKKEKTTNWITEFSGTDYSFKQANKLSFNNDENSRYQFRLTISDTFSTENTNSITFDISSKFVLLSIHESGTGLNFGKPAVRENIIEINIPVYIKKIEQEKWTKMHLYNSTKPYDAKNELKYFKDPLGLVHIQGIVKDTTSEWLARIERADCRPEKDLIVSVPCTGFKFAILKIYEDGNILIENRSGISTNWISLDGITFKAKE